MVIAFIKYLKPEIKPATKHRKSLSLTLKINNNLGGLYEIM